MNDKTKNLLSFYSLDLNTLKQNPSSYLHSYILN